jgi:RimJ/RimL family protein N-acetyltransferase
MLTIRPTEIDDASQVAACIDSVAQERRFLGNTKGFPVDQTRKFIKLINNIGGVHLVVLDGDTIVGWCDITPHPNEGLTHVGSLGMGVLPKYRHKGWGTKLVSEALQVAFKKDLERIELEVFASNVGAIRLYQNTGFIEEGCKRDARKLDGQYDDIIMFGLLKKNWLTSRSR